MKPIVVDGAFSVADGESLKLRGTGFDIVQTDPDHPTTFANNGDVVVRTSAAGGGPVGMTTEGGADYPREFEFGNGGDFRVLGSGDSSSATGFELYFSQNVFNNGGLFEVDAAGYALGGFANGYLNVYNLGDWDVTSSADLAVGLTVETSGDIFNAARIAVSGAEEGYGVNFNNSGAGSFVNTGDLHVVGGHGGAIGVGFRDGDYAFDNRGTIEVSDSDPATASIGVAFERDGGASYGSLSNSGTIQADYAFREIHDYGRTASQRIDNSGVILGKVALGGSDDGLSNTGSITGDVLLGSGDDTFSETGAGVVHGTVFGGAGADTLVGGSGADVLSGDSAGLKARSGEDVLVGGHGADTLTGGGGGDVFTYDTVKDSTRTATDVITDLGTGDTIDLSAIDADRHASGDQAFTLVSAFDHHAGQLVLSYDAAAKATWLLGDTDGDGKADLVVKLSGDHHDFNSFVF